MANTRQPHPTAKPSPEPTQRLLSLGEIIYGLAEVFGFNMTDRARDAYIATVGHRTDEDLNRAYLSVLRDSRFMPRPSDLLEACGIPKTYRDGSKPE